MFPALSSAPRVGDLVLAKYDLDGYYYRALIRSLIPGTVLSPTYFMCIFFSLVFPIFLPIHTCTRLLALVRMFSGSSNSNTVFKLQNTSTYFRLAKQSAT